MCHHHAEFCFRRAPGHDTIPPDSLPPVNKDAPVFQGLPHFHLRSHPSGLFHSHLCQHSKRSLSSHLKYSQAFPALLSQALASITPSHSVFSKRGFFRPDPLPPSSLYSSSGPKLLSCFHFHMFAVPASLSASVSGLALF